MLDIKFIRENQKLVQQTANDKGILHNGLPLPVSLIVHLDDKRKNLQKQFDDIRAAQNEASDRIANAVKEEKDALINEIRIGSQTLQSIKNELSNVQQELDAFMLSTPAIPAKGWPVGASEANNNVIETWGEPTKFGFKPKSHIELGIQNDWIDFERGVKFSGARGYFLKGFAARLEQAVLRYAIDVMIKQGFTFMATPTLGQAQFFYGTGHFPFAQTETFQAKSLHDELYLTGTAEVPLMAYHADEILDEKDLPKKYVGFSPCYRTEVGGYGKDTKGLYRVKMFYKVEQVILCKAEPEEAHQYFLQIAEYSKAILRDLGLAHRVMQVCTGDMGAGKVEMYDLETWMPSRNAYGETHSCSRLDDWQTRRLKIRYRTADGQIKHAFSLNNTVIASPRILIPLLEIYQQADGTVQPPKILEPYL